MPTKTGKKNFKDRTGIKFADLIMPMIMGGIGSYSRPAGRGVHLGLQAYRTLQAGREYGREREVGEELSNKFTQDVEDLRETRATVENGRTKEDPSMTSSFGFHKDTGPNFADPERTGRIARGEEEPQNVANMFDNKEGIEQMINASLMQGGVEDISAAEGAEAPAAPEFSQMMANQEMAAPAAAQYADAILGKKKESENTARRLGLIDREIRFYETMAILGKTNPGSAGYLSGMQHLQFEKERASIEQRFDVHKFNTESRAETHKNTLIELKKKQDHEKAMIEMKAAISPYLFFQSGNTVVAYERGTGKQILSDEIGPRELDEKEWAALGADKRLDFFIQAERRHTEMQAKIQARLMDPNNPAVKAALLAYSSIMQMVTQEDIFMFQQETGRVPPPVVDVAEDDAKTDEQLALEAEESFKGITG